MSDSYDEISLRELYLIVRRGMPLIAGLTVLAAAAAFIVVTLLPERFEAEATVLINPSPVRLQGGGALALEQRFDMSYETYRSLAFSRTVLEEALAALPGSELDVAQLRGAGSLEKLVGPDRPDQVAQMTVSHDVTHRNPALAEAAADAWAAATVAHVRQTLLASLAPIRDSTAQQLSSLEAELTAVEERWQEFQARDERALITAELDGVAERLSLTQGMLEQTERDIAASRARREVLAQPADAVAPGEEGDFDAAAEAAVAQLADGAGPGSETAAQLGALLGSGARGDVLDLVRNLELQSQTTELAALQAQRETLQAQLAAFQRQADELRRRLAALTLEGDRLERELTIARASYDEVASLEPALAYIGELAPNTSRVLSDASLPTEPVGPAPLLIAILSAVAAFSLGLLFVFLRAAVAEPVPAAAAAGAQSEGEQIRTAAAR